MMTRATEAQYWNDGVVLLAASGISQPYARDFQSFPRLAVGPTHMDLLMKVLRHFSHGPSRSVDYDIPVTVTCESFHFCLNVSIFRCAKKGRFE
jgi:hypothetical protein